MQKLKDKILKEGKVLPDSVVKVDSFLNHQIDVKFLEEIGKEFYDRYVGEDITKVITIEASGIPIAVEVARCFGCKVVFAKKGKTKNLSDAFYETEVMSYTHGTKYNVCLAKEFLGKDDTVLIIDDFLARGEALKGLIDIVNKSQAKLVGCGIVVEKGFQPGGKELREKGIKIESLAIIDNIDEANQKITFRGE